MSRLLEICVQCGFVHRDDRTNTRQRKAHYHWIPPDGERYIDDIVLHATVCLSCLQQPIDWQGYAQSRRDTPDEYYISDSFNATLPADFPQQLLNDRYQQYCNALAIDASRW